MRIENSSDFIIKNAVIAPAMKKTREPRIHPRHAYPGGPQDDALLAYKSAVEGGDYSFSYERCPVCASTRFTKFAEIDRFSNDCPTVVCDGCGLIQTQPMPSQASLSHYYANIYTPMYRGVHSSGLSNFDAPSRIKTNFLNRLEKNGVLKELRKDDLVVEAGCGDGSLLSLLAQAEPHAKYVGFDFDDTYMATGRSRGLDLRTGTYAADSSIKDVSLLYYHHVLEHIRDQRAEFEAMAKVVRDDGLLVIVVPGMFNILSSNGGDILEKLQNAHLYYFDLSTLVGIAEQYGFQLLTGNEGIFSIFRKVGSRAKHHFPAAIQSTRLPRALEHDRKMLYLRCTHLLFERSPSKSTSIVLDHILRHLHPLTGKSTITISQLKAMAGKHVEALNPALSMASDALGLRVSDDRFSIDIPRIAA